MCTISIYVLKGMDGHTRLISNCSLAIIIALLQHHNLTDVSSIVAPRTNRRQGSLCMVVINLWRIHWIFYRWSKLVLIMWYKINLTSYTSFFEFELFKWKVKEVLYNRSSSEVSGRPSRVFWRYKICIKPPTKIPQFNLEFVLWSI